MKTAAGAAALVFCMALAAGASAGEAQPPAFRTSGPGCPAGVGPQVTAASFQVARQAQPRPRAGVRPAAQVTRSEKADVTFELRPSADGGAELTATNGGVQITKTVRPTGEFVLTLKSGADVVTMTVTGKGTTVSRGRQSVALPRGVDAPGRRPAARRMLADSESVVRYRGMADALMAANDRSPAALGVIIADAMLGVLSGDVGAPRRIAEYLAHGGTKRMRPAGMAIDCFTLMEQRMTEAWNDYVACWFSVGNIMFSDYWQELCAARWLIQVESYWFNFISCSGFNF